MLGKHHPVGLTLALGLVLGNALQGCSRDEAQQSHAQPPASVATAKASTAAAKTVALFNPPFKFRAKDTPDPGSACTFEPRDPAERPPGLEPANHDSNVIFLQKPKGPLWSHAEADRALAELTPDHLIIAARHQKPDLWIKATRPMATLETSADRLTCY